MARLQKPEGEHSQADLVFNQRDGTKGYSLLKLYTHSGRAWLHFCRYTYDPDAPYGGFQYAHTFGGIKGLRKFAFAILDATGGREE